MAALHDIVAFRGRKPVADFTELLGDLRDSWVLGHDNVRLTANGSGGFSWRLPYFIRKWNCHWNKEPHMKPRLSIKNSSSFQKGSEARPIGVRIGCREASSPAC